MNPKQVSEMEYSDTQKQAILSKKTYEGYTYYIVSYGTHPCAYISIPPESQYYGKTEEEIKLECHGGITYSKPHLQHIDPQTEHDDNWIIGWDYAHSGDYFLSNSGGKQWTIQEITQECESVINQIIQTDNSNTTSMTQEKRKKLVHERLTILHLQIEAAQYFMKKTITETSSETTKQLQELLTEIECNINDVRNRIEAIDYWNEQEYKRQNPDKKMP